MASGFQVARRRNEEWTERVRRASANLFVRELFKGDRVTVTRLGLTFDLNLSDNLQRELFLTGTYEPDFMGFLEAQVRPGDTYIDVGGHIGLDAFVAARKMAGCGRVFCFEPSPDSAESVRVGAARNGLASLVTVIECGLANDNGRLVLRTDPYYLPDDQGTRSRYNDGDVVVDAPLRRFDDWAAETGLERMDVVKLDIEGGEYEALVGMGGRLHTMQPRLVVVEVVDRRLRQAGASTAMLDDLLADFGYERTGQVFFDNVVYRPR